MDRNKSKTLLKILEFIEATTRLWGILTMIGKELIIYSV